jgi:flagellar export protein FliJ
VTPFRFPLDRVLDWRRIQMRAEEEKLAIEQQKLDQVTQRIQTLASAEMRSEWDVRKLETAGAGDLRALSAFQTRARKMNEALIAEKQKCEKQIVAQRARLIKARKDFRILEKLKERRHKTWMYLSEREIENIAAEAHLSRIARERGEA